jgi:hypothetical protein
LYAPTREEQIALDLVGGIVEQSERLERRAVVAFRMPAKLLGQGHRC